MRRRWTQRLLDGCNKERESNVLSAEATRREREGGGERERETGKAQHREQRRGKS